jgi:hypothetical protein
LWLCGASLAWGCAGLVGTGGGRGACQTEHERCVTQCGEDLAKPRDCELSCDYEARLCARRQNEERIASNVDPIVAIPELGPPQTLSVDLRNGRIGSNGPHVTFNGPAKPVEGAYQVDPGATLRMTFPVPAGAREAVLTLLHGAGGDGVGCFVTMAVGDQPVLARYAPPRTDAAGLLRPERWDVAFALPERGAGEEAPTDVTVFLYNNQAAGSRSPYLIAAAELTYRSVTAPK